MTDMKRRYTYPEDSDPHFLDKYPISEAEKERVGQVHREAWAAYHRGELKNSRDIQNAIYEGLTGEKL